MDVQGSFLSLLQLPLHRDNHVDGMRDYLRACATPVRVGPITIGGRSDHSGDRHFKGAMRSVSIYSSALTPTEIQCIFTQDDAVFSGALAPSSNGATVACPAMGWLALLTMLAVWGQ